MRKTIFSIIFCLTLLTPALAFADDNKFTEGYKETADYIGYTEKDNLKKNIPEFIGLIINIILSVVGIIFLGLMIYGGFIWMNAKGNEAETKKAQDIIQNAIIGIVVVFAAYVITNLVIYIFFAARHASNIGF